LKSALKHSNPATTPIAARQHMGQVREIADSFALPRFHTAKTLSGSPDGGN